ncbi:MAG TPA: HAMP domain-containing sensor histidine kinase [Mycobacteriales bacterium]|nr:HAMP domain-containing sensor histidine kinase [Mycobacteriales bacterium]
MSLRTKLVAALIAVSAMATLSIGVFSYRATAERLRVEVDRSLDEAVRDTLDRRRDLAGPARGVRPAPFRAPPGGGFDIVVVQVVRPDGIALRAVDAVPLPVDTDDVRVAAAAGPRREVRRDVSVGGRPYRLLTVGLSAGGALQAGRSLAETERLLDSLRNRTVVMVLAVTAGAALVGWLIARQVTERLVALTRSAQHVATTGRLDVDVPVDGADEAGRLGAAFSEMLGALTRSREDQHRLVQDAGHELRTPLTSLRTNIAVLRSFDRLTPEERARLVDDLDGESRELTDLVNELVDLAVDRRGEEPAEPVDLAAVARRVADRAARRTGRSIEVVADAEPPVTARAAAVERAIANLVDNAAKFSADDAGPIEVVVRGGRVEVLDRGPGIDDADLPRVFDRFYRAVAARARPGSGLGLAIVKGVAESHGGSVFAGNRPGGGASIGFVLPAG